MLFFQLKIFVVELMSTPKIFKFFPVPPEECEKNLFLSNPIPYPKYSYRSTSTCFVTDQHQHVLLI